MKGLSNTTNNLKTVSNPAEIRNNLPNASQKYCHLCQHAWLILCIQYRLHTMRMVRNSHIHSVGKGPSACVVHAWLLKLYF
jgi:hypothetical protein